MTIFKDFLLTNNTIKKHLLMIFLKLLEKIILKFQNNFLLILINYKRG